VAIRTHDATSSWFDVQLVKPDMSAGRFEVLSKAKSEVGVFAAVADESCRDWFWHGCLLTSCVAEGMLRAMVSQVMGAEGRILEVLGLVNPRLRNDPVDCAPE
jgi:hypothetical protein